MRRLRRLILIEPPSRFTANVKQPPFVPRGSIYRYSSDKRDRESRNGYIQAAFVVFEAQKWSPDSRLTVDLICELQRLAVNQIYRCGGHLRDGPVVISGVAHQPPEHTVVPELVDSMCLYVTENWGKPAIHLASYLMWRMNWIHPFFGGNGRTARAVSYLILCARLGFVLPGTPTIPELIVKDRTPYFRALRKADEAAKASIVDVSEMEDLMDNLLAEQLVSIHEMATGKPAVDS
jgi:Fic family protein